jgi:molybdate transport system substrate-binding protein
VFAAADREHAEALVAQGLLGAVEVFARNRLVIVVPARLGTLRRLEHLARPGSRVVVAGPAVPAGRYTNQVLARLSRSATFGGEFAGRVQANVVSHETSVRAVLSKVALGEADAGFVYATDAPATDAVTVIEIPDPYNVIAEYPIGVCVRSDAPAPARAFVALVLGPEGQAVLRRHGFFR